MYLGHVTYAGTGILVMSDVIIFSAFLEDLYKKYLFECLIYVCHRIVIEDLFYYITQ